MAEGLSDFDLLDAWGNGDLNAGGVLFERHFRTLYRFLRTKVEAGLEDLLQQIWLACVEGRARFRREASFRTYLLRVARFQLYAHYRARNREPSQIDFTLTSVADLDASPSQLLARRQDERLLLEALKRVPLDHQIALELRFWEDLSGPEMAEVLGIPEPAVRSRIRRATERLKQELTALMTGPAGADESIDDLDGWAQRLRQALFAD
ncbi:MAG TPA: sigma-70 family RNA polymerase sigma factor [Polyangiaceae bacterium]|nr:sigma-70 family RNA polymerase sigma factor [Polyangiaceae bacterium]